MSLFLGFDPGGAGAFGWCVVEGSSLPLKVIGRGVALHAQDAFDAAIAVAGKDVAGIGIDAPLFWRCDGDRQVDQVVRGQVVRLGARGGTVNSVNSMRGACLVQGIMIGLLARELAGQKLPLTESHPKAALWLLRLAVPGRPSSAIALDRIPKLFRGNVRGASDHERDAALGGLSAFAMANRLNGWQDLFLQEVNPVLPLSPPLGYWMPCGGDR